MFARAAKPMQAIPSRNALQTLRQLVLAGTTVGGLCAVAAITYDSHRRVRVAEKIIENKRLLQTSTPYFDARSSAMQLAAMMEAAEQGRLEEWRNSTRKKKKEAIPQAHVEEENPSQDLSLSSDPPASGSNFIRSIPPRSPFKFLNPNLNLIQSSWKENETTQNWDALSPEDDKSGETKASITTEETHLRQMILQGKEVEATDRFIKLTPSGSSMSDDRRELAYQLFAANCVKANVFVARSLFHHLETLMTIDEELWAMMMHLLAKYGNLEAVGRIYDRHHENLTVPAHLQEVVLRCLLESRRLNAAKRLFYSRVQEDENCGLSGAYLDSLWRKTHSIDLIQAEFQLIVERLRSANVKLNTKIFNPLIKAFVESGKFEDAEAAVRDMKVKWNVQPDTRSLGLLAYRSALECDWDGVMAKLREIQSLGLARDARDFAMTFDRVFLEFYPAHTGEEVWDFLTSCLTEFNVRPDHTLHRHIMEALIERGDTTMIDEITFIAKAENWQSGLSENDIVNLTKSVRAAMEDSPVGAWRTLQAAKKQYGLVSTTRRLMGTSADSYRLSRDVLTPVRTYASESYPGGLKKLAAKWAVERHISLRKRMEQAIHAGRFSGAVDAFHMAVQNGYNFRTVHVQLATIAAIFKAAPVDLAEAKQVIGTHYPWWGREGVRRSAPRPRFPPIFFQQLRQVFQRSARDVVLYKMALFEFYNICASDAIFVVKHHAAASLARKLIKETRQEAAILVLRGVYVSKWRKSHGFDQVLIKLLLRAFADTHFARGVWWCMVAVLARDEPISRDFVAEVQRKLPKLEEGLMHRVQYSGYPNLENIPVIKKVAEIVEKKASGDEYWKEVKSDPAFKREFRSRGITRTREQQKYLPANMSVEQMITEFDEEIEFDLLFRDQHFHGNSYEFLLAWDETIVPFQTRTAPESSDYPLFAVAGTKKARY